MRTMHFKEANAIFKTRDGLECLVNSEEANDKPAVIYRLLLGSSSSSGLTVRRYELVIWENGELPVYQETQ